MTKISSLALVEKPDTPFLAIDKDVMLRNIERMRKHIGSRSDSVTIRPHFKTLRTLEAAPYLLSDQSQPITVSTLKEAEALAAVGYSNMTYAVGIAAHKLPRVQALLAQDVDCRIILDNQAQVTAVNDFCQQTQCTIAVMIELDCDGHRGGIRADDAELITLARQLQDGAAEFRGVLTHAGESYHCHDAQQLRQAAQAEVDAARLASQRLRNQGIACAEVSVGSTPTALSDVDLRGISEVRAGVYTLFDLVMYGIGVCQLADIAARVVTTVIGHNAERGWLLTDAGWMALSSDRGSAATWQDHGYGLLADSAGNLLQGLQVSQANQEHGVITRTDGKPLNVDDFAIGTRLQILPNHACATLAMHDHYQVFDDQHRHQIWSRIRGW